LHWVLNSTCVLEVFCTYFNWVLNRTCVQEVFCPPKVALKQHQITLGLFCIKTCTRHWNVIKKLHQLYLISCLMLN
jgi:hypothetical protein